ncbi:MAG TPA: esterase-like activity of phytase family protein [Gemmatimonadota bacterium]|nr:esterase-like activity of phytase family protein [Gemmatimonadota bacterium]
MPVPSRIVPALLGIGLAPWFASPATAQVELVDVGRFNFTGGGSADTRLAAEELSGLARVTGNRYVTVGDDHATLHFLEIEVDPQTGRVRSVGFGEPVPLLDPEGRPLPARAEGADREDVIYDPVRGTVWIADERDSGDPSRPSLVEVDPESGREIGRIVPDTEGPLSVYDSIRPNYGFESLGRDEDGESMWTANEEALTMDGPLASPSSGSIVRIQEIDDEDGPTRQIAYVTDATNYPIKFPPGAVGEDRSGLSALLPLDEDRLLVLERGLAGSASGLAEFRIRIYLADLEDATDVSAATFRTGLAGRTDWEPARKTLLFERRFGLPVSNFEGMAFGPRLANGERSVLLIADNGGGTWQSIYALRLREKS